MWMWPIPCAWGMADNADVMFSLPEARPSSCSTARETNGVRRVA